MKSLLLSVALGAGILSITPEEAKAFHPMGMGMFGMHGGTQLQFFGTPTFKQQISGSNVMLTINSPAGFRAQLTPTGVEQMFFGARTETINFNTTTGIRTVSSTALTTQSVFTPYANLPRPFFQIGNSIALNPISSGLFSGVSSMLNFGTGLGTSSLFSPVANFAASTRASSLNSLGIPAYTLAGTEQSEAAAAYSDYVPPGYIK
jgi:hypothetical protein